MLKRLLFSVVMLTHLACMGAADGDDTMQLSMWSEEVDLHKVVEIVALPGVLTEPMVVKTKVVCDAEARSLTVRTALIVHADNRVAEIFARHVAADHFLFSPWRKQACSEIKALQSPNCAQTQQQEEAMMPTILASITLKRTPDRAWPDYEIYTESFRRLTRYAISNHNEQGETPSLELLYITPVGAHSYSQNPSVKQSIKQGHQDSVEKMWQVLLATHKQVGVKLNYLVINEMYDELFQHELED